MSTIVPAWKTAGNFTEGQSPRLQPRVKGLLPTGPSHATNRSHSLSCSDKSLSSRTTSGGKKRSWGGHCPVGRAPHTYVKQLVLREQWPPARVVQEDRSSRSWCPPDPSPPCCQSPLLLLVPKGQQLSGARVWNMGGSSTASRKTRGKAGRRALSIRGDHCSSDRPGGRSESRRLEGLCSAWNNHEPGRGGADELSSNFCCFTELWLSSASRMLIQKDQLTLRKAFLGYLLTGVFLRSSREE